jgi:hypothetical protein
MKHILNNLAQAAARRGTVPYAHGDDGEMHLSLSLRFLLFFYSPNEAMPNNPNLKHTHPRALITKEHRAARCACVLIHLTPPGPPPISREISQASASTVRAHFGCIFKATADCATGVWCVFYVRILGT